MPECNEVGQTRTMGVAGCSNVKSRSVAEEHNSGPRLALCRASSSMDVVKLVISEVALSGRNDTLMVLDSRRACF